jgi:hypothetical protein
VGATPVLDATPLTSAEEAFVAQSEHSFTAEGAYAQLQGTRPAKLAAGLSDSGRAGRVDGGEVPGVERQRR